MKKLLLAAIFWLLSGCAAKTDFINSLFGFETQSEREQGEADAKLREKGIHLSRPDLLNRKDYPEHQEDRLPRVIYLEKEKVKQLDMDELLKNE